MEYRAEGREARVEFTDSKFRVEALRLAEELAAVHTAHDSIDVYMYVYDFNMVIKRV
jgi:hypothetical protein